MLENILFGASFLFTLIIVFYMFAKLTPDSTPPNLAGLFSITFKLVIAVVIAFYVAVFVINNLLG